jgi:hypothetical protein
MLSGTKIPEDTGCAWAIDSDRTKAKAMEPIVTFALIVGTALLSRLAGFPGSFDGLIPVMLQRRSLTFNRSARKRRSSNFLVTVGAITDDNLAVSLTTRSRAIGGYKIR